LLFLDHGLLFDLLFFRGFGFVGERFDFGVRVLYFGLPGVDFGSAFVDLQFEFGDFGGGGACGPFVGFDVGVFGERVAGFLDAVEPLAGSELQALEHVDVQVGDAEGLELLVGEFEAAFRDGGGVVGVVVGERVELHLFAELGEGLARALDVGPVVEFGGVW